MVWQWIKSYMPRGLYGRAALILILPVLTLQLLVSVVFIQRHFDGVTRSMTSDVGIEVRYLRDTVNESTSLEEAQARLQATAVPLEMIATLPANPSPEADIKLFQDLTGSVVIETIRDNVPEIQVVSLFERRVILWIDTNYGVLNLDFSRRRVSASNPHQLLVILVVMGAIMTTISYFFLRNQLRPIKRMAAAAAAYGKGRIKPFTLGGY